MAKAKTSTFFIRREVSVATTTPNVVTIDTSAYVDPADRQGLMIEEVDYIFSSSGNNLPFLVADRAVAVQLLSGAYTTLQSYAEEDLISSGGLIFDAQKGQHNSSDLYPDALASDGGRIVVDDQMSLIGKINTASSGMVCAVLIKCKVVTLSNKDYMALALQTVAN